MPAIPQEAEIGTILDAFASTALLEMGTASSLGTAGIVAAFGQAIPESYNGAGFPQMLFWIGPGGGEAEPRTANAGRASTGQWTEINEVQGVLVLGDRNGQSVTTLLQAMYPWERRVWSAFWKHQQLVTGSPPAALVEYVRPVKWRPRLDMPWGTSRYGVMIFTWDVGQIIRSVPAGR